MAASVEKPTEQKMVALADLSSKVRIQNQGHQDQLCNCVKISGVLIIVEIRRSIKHNLPHQ